MIKERETPLRSFRQLSLECENGEKWLSNLLNDRNLENSMSGPGFFAMRRLADVWQVSMDELGMRGLWISEQAIRSQTEALIGLATDGDLSDTGLAAPTSNSLMRTFKKSGGRIEAFENTFAYAAPYKPLQSMDERLFVKAVGRMCLAAVTLQSHHVSDLQSSLDKLEGTEELRVAKEDHLLAIERGAYATTKRLDHPVPGMPIHVRMDYIATYLHVRDATGEDTVLLYCSLIL